MLFCMLQVVIQFLFHIVCQFSQDHSPFPNNSATLTVHYVLIFIPTLDLVLVVYSFVPALMPCCLFLCLLRSIITDRVSLEVLSGLKLYVEQAGFHLLSVMINCWCYYTQLTFITFIYVNVCLCE